MSYKMLTKISIRLIALFYFANYFVITISSVISILEVLRQPVEYAGIGLLSAFTPMSLMIVISILLWLYADKITDRLIGEASVEGTIQDIDYNKIQYIAFSVAGILIICNSIPDLLSTIYQIRTIPISPIELADRIYNGFIAKIIGAIIKIILGLWLVLGARGISNMIMKLRTVGLND